MNHDVFISYAQPDKIRAFAVHDALRARGLKSWIAPSANNGIVSGGAFDEEIVKAIRSCKVFVLIYSAHCNLSVHVPIEIRHAENKIKIPFILDSSVMSDKLSYFLKGIQYIDARGEDLEGPIERLFHDVHYHTTGNRFSEGASTDRLLFNEGLKLLNGKNYQTAEKRLNTYVEIAPDDSEGRFYLALSILSGRKARKLDGQVVRRLETILNPGIDSAGHGYLNILLAIIKYGYYAMNGFKEKGVTVTELLLDARITREKAEEIIYHTNDPENAVWMELYNIYKP